MHPFLFPFHRWYLHRCRMLLCICSTSQPIDCLVVQYRQTIIASSPEKVVFDVFYHVFYFPFTLRVTFTTETHREWSALTIGTERLSKDQITFVFIHQQHFVLIVNKFMGLAAIECESSLMRFNCSFSGKWMLIENNKLEA